MAPLDRFCIHTITTKPWALDAAVRNYAAAGVFAQRRVGV